MCNIGTMKHSSAQTEKQIFLFNSEADLNFIVFIVSLRSCIRLNVDTHIEKLGAGHIDERILGINASE